MLLNPNYNVVKRLLFGFLPQRSVKFLTIYLFVSNITQILPVGYQ